MKLATKLFATLAVAALVMSGLRAEDKPAEKPGFIGIKIKMPEGDAKSVTVEEVIEDGPAAKGGLKAEDEILKIGGKEFENLEAFVKLVRAHKVGDTVTLTIKRDGKEQELKIKAAAAPEPTDK